MADLPGLQAVLAAGTEARRRAVAARQVVDAYGRVPGSTAAAEAAACARIDWEVASREAGELLRQAAALAEKLATEAVREAEQLRELNRQLHTDNARLRLELRRQFGVEPKAMGGTRPAPPLPEPPTPPDGAPSTAPADRTPRKRGAPAGHRGATRPRPDPVQATVLRPGPSVCPCGCTDIEPTDLYDEQLVEDIQCILRTVTAVRAPRGRCRRCGKVLRSPSAPNGPPVVTGPNLAVLLTLLRQMGLTNRKLAFFSTEMLGITLTPSGAMGIVNRICDHLEPVADAVESALRTQSHLGADETSWRIQRRNGYIWCFCNQRLVCYVPDHSRSAAVPKRVLGEHFPGTVTCDFYGAYNFLTNLQRCWIHLLRAIADERKIRPDCTALETFQTDAWAAYRRAEELQGMPPGDLRSAALAELRKTLDLLAQTPLPKGKPRALARRIGKYREQLLRFVDDPLVPAHNNRSERQVRPMVVNRKTSFGSDTMLGAKRLCRLATVTETSRLNGHRLVPWLRQAVASPRDQLPSPFASSVPPGR